MLYNIYIYVCVYHTSILGFLLHQSCNLRYPTNSAPLARDSSLDQNSRLGVTWVDRGSVCETLIESEMYMVFCGNFKCKDGTHPKDHWTLKTGYFEDPTPATHVQTLPLEGPRSLGYMKKWLIWCHFWQTQILRVFDSISKTLH